MINRTDEAYQDLLKKIIVIGKEKGDRTGTGTISIFSHTLEIDMADGFPLLTTKKMFTKGITHELLWFLKGDTNIQYLVENGVNIWTPDAYRKYKNTCELAKKDLGVDNVSNIETIEDFKVAIKTDPLFAKEHGELGPIYGKQWRKWKTFANGTPTPERPTDSVRYIDQIQNAIDLLKNNPDSRRIMVNAWNVAELDEMALPPCHWAFELYTEELTLDERMDYWQTETDIVFCGGTVNHVLLDVGNIPRRKLSLKWHQRSVDTFLGLPFNIASYGLLLEMIAQQCNMVPDKLIGDLTNVHIYKNHIEQCKEQISREPLKLPTLRLEKTNDIFSYCYEDVKIEDYSSHPTIKGDISV